MTREEAYQRLREGNERFAAGQTASFNFDLDHIRRLAEYGQSPFATILGCSDSRVPVEYLFDVNIGDLFVVRVAGNVCDIDEIASIEYGVDHLGTPLLVILGHTECGAVTAIAEGHHLGANLIDHLDNIVVSVERARREHPELRGRDFINACAQMNIWISIEDLFRGGSAVRKLVREGGLLVVGALYQLDTGVVKWMGPHPGEADLICD
jgi:carbonic anhydrase